MVIDLRFATALRASAGTGRLALIAEIKPATAEGIDLLAGRDPASVAQAYVAGGAACLSVVTGRWYGGSPQLLERLAAQVSLPILRKDFIVNRGELKRSARLGAAAVLLTRKLLRAKDLHALAMAALDEGLTPFVEVASNRELEGLALPTAAVIAVNNRDIEVREKSGEGIDRSLRLLDRARSTGAGLVASASGITLPEEARELARAGFDAALVGTALLQSPDPPALVHKITDPTTDRP
jgi:indole-3-glycerol phosphate synthase